jgi:hypothetical protein
MRNVYRGIDIAGDRSLTGLAELVEQGSRLYARVDQSGFRDDPTRNGLLRMRDDEFVVGCAIDQPLGFPASTLRLLSLESRTLDAVPQYFSTYYRYREADVAMRDFLRERYSLDPNYVLPPVVCDNVWRALYLLVAAGQSVEDVRLGRSAWCETHPRLCVTSLVPQDCCDLVERYKSKAPRRGPRDDREASRWQHSLQQRVARMRCLDFLSNRLPSLVLDGVNRERALADDNAFEALFCAVAAFAKARQRVKRFPEKDLPEADARLEGYVFVPDWPSLNS